MMIPIHIDGEFSAVRHNAGEVNEGASVHENFGAVDDLGAWDWKKRRRK